MKNNNMRTSIPFTTCPTGFVNVKSAQTLDNGYVIAAFAKKIFGRENAANQK